MNSPNRICLIAVAFSLGLLIVINCGCEVNKPKQHVQTLDLSAKAENALVEIPGVELADIGRQGGSAGLSYHTGQQYRITGMEPLAIYALIQNSSEKHIKAVNGTVLGRSGGFTAANCSLAIDFGYSEGHGYFCLTATKGEQGEVFVNVFYWHEG